MSALLWFFAIVGYLGIGTVVSALVNRDSVEPDPPIVTVALGWLPIGVVMVGFAVTLVAASVFAYPFRWLYYTIAGDEAPSFIILDERSPSKKLPRATGSALRRTDDG